jgi:hypothetical protein
MTERSATVFACDELLFNMTGKVMIQGLYTSGDIAIPSHELRINQLVFCFSVETAITEPLSSVTLRVTLPGSEPNHQHALVPPFNPLLLGHPRRGTIKNMLTFLIQQPLLKPGAIRTSVIHDKGEIDAGTIWVTSLAATVPVGNEPS